MNPRRYFRFRLRTLLVLTFAISFPLSWAGYSLAWIRERQAAAKLPGVGVRRQGFLPKAAPAGLWLFGESGARYVSVYSCAPISIDRIKQLFPEARVFDPARSIMHCGAPVSRGDEQ